MCVCVCVCVYLELLSHFLPFKIHLTDISPILIKMVDFKNLAWATSFATWASRKFIYLPYRASGEKSYCHTLPTQDHCAPTISQCWFCLPRCWFDSTHPKGPAYIHQKSRSHTGPLWPQYITLLVRFSTSQRIYLHSPDVQVPHRAIVALVHHSVGSILHIPEDLSTITRSPGSTQDHCATSISVLVLFAKVLVQFSTSQGSIFTKLLVRFPTSQRIYLHSPEVEVPHRTAVAPVYHSVGSLLHIPQACSGVS